MKSLLIFLLLIAIGSPTPDRAADLPRVLLIGDSISKGYAPFVTMQLEGEAEVTRIEGNGQHTGTGLRKLNDWLGDTEWDIIHFNWGLWDLCYRHPDSQVQGNRDKVNGTVAIPPDEYRSNLEQLVRRLQETGAELIWAHTTVVPEGEAGRFVGDDAIYNAAAVGIMNRYGVRINDLHALSSTFPSDHFIGPGNVHFTEQGSRKLARQVAAHIRQVLSGK